MSSTREDPGHVIEVENAIPPRPAPLWRNLNYLLLWGGQTVSWVGSSVSGIAFPLMVLALSHSPAQLGFMAAVTTLPFIVLGLPAGAFIDRWDRKRVMIICDTARALGLGSIPIALFLGHLTLAQLYVVALIEGTAAVFFDLAQTASLTRVVTRPQLPAAASQNQTTDGVVSLVGPSLGGLLFTLKPVLPFLADALSYAVSIFSLFLIKVPFQQERQAVPRKLRVEIGEGLRWLWGKPLIRYLAILTGSIGLASGCAPTIIIVLATRQHASPALIGLIFTIGAIGSIFGAMVGGWVQGRVGFSKAILGTCLLFVLLWPTLALAPNIFFLGIIMAGFSLLGPIYNVIQISYRLSLIPDELQGRVNSVFRLIVFSFRPVGLTAMAFLLQTIDVVPTILVIAAYLVLVAIVMMLSPHIRNAPPLAEDEEQEQPA